MAKIYHDPVLQGFIAQDPLIHAGTLQPIGSNPQDSAYNVADTIPGMAVYQYGSIAASSATAGNLGPRMRLELLGGQTTDYEIWCTRAGMPGSGCEVAVEMDDGSDGANWRALETPQVHQQIAEARIDRGQDDAHNWAGVDLENGEALIVWAAAGVINGRRYDLATHDWAAAAVTIADQARAMDADGATPQAAALGDNVVDVLRLDSGRLLVCTIVQGPALDGNDLAIHYSDDDGLTWRSLTLQGYDVTLPGGTGVDYTAISWAHYGEQVLLLVTTTWPDGDDTRSGWVQYASSDAGHSFDFVETWNTSPFQAYDAQRPDICTTLDGTFVVAYYRDDSGVPKTYVRRVQSPYLPLTAADEQLVAGTATTSQDVSLWSTTDGAVYLARSPGERITVHRSLDYGASWTEYATGLGKLPGGGVDRFRAISIGPRVLWTLNSTTVGLRPAQQLMLLESGGWSMVPMPRVAAGHPIELRGFGGSSVVTDAATWYPLTTPATVGWTRTGAAPTYPGVGAFRLPITGQVYWTRAFGSHAPDDGIVVHFELSTSVTSANTAAPTLGVNINLGDGSTSDVKIQCRLANGEVGIYDANASLAAVGTAALDCTVRRVFRLALRYNGAGNTVTLYSRLASSRFWQRHITGVVVRNTTTPATSQVVWGNHATGQTSEWYFVGVTVQDGIGIGNATTDALAAGLVIDKAPDSLPGAPLPAYPGRLHLRDDGYLRGRDGPGARGDYWEIEPDSRYPVRNLLTRSPQEEARTDTDNTAHRYMFGPRGGTVEHHPGGASIGWGVVGANFRYLHLRAGSAGAIATLGTLDLAHGLTSLPYTRTGDTIRVHTGAAGGLVRPRDVVGGTVATNAGDRYRIVRATSGVWRDGSAAATLQVDGAPAGTATGTLDIWRPDGAAVLLGYTTAHPYWGVEHGTDQTVDDDYRVGRLFVGPAVILGQRWSKGRQATYQPQVDAVEIPGAYAARELAPMQRLFAVGWTEGTPTYWGSNPSFQEAGGMPVAMVGDLSPVETLTAEAGGGRVPVLMLSRIEHDPDAGAAQTVQCIGREKMVYGRLEGAPVIEDIDGDESHSAVQRVSGLELVEEV
jgi:hypothetical protein